MTGMTALAIFCEDIRDEKSGGQTIVGAMRDNIALAVMPGMLPKLGIFIRVNLPLNADVHAAHIYMVMPTGERPLIGHIAEDVVTEALRSARAEDAPAAGIISSVLAAPFPVEKPAQISVEMEYGGEIFVMGWLNFREGTQPD